VCIVENALACTVCQGTSYMPCRFVCCLHCLFAVNNKLRMLYRFQDCGHTACLSCLQHFFDANALSPIQELAEELAEELTTGQDISSLADVWWAFYRGTLYKCPSCSDRSGPFQKHGLNDIMADVSDAILRAKAILGRYY
jgi:hypothetical protein